MEFLVLEGGDRSRYPPGVLLVGVALISFLPYYVVKREDSGHSIAYAFSYAFLIIFLLLDFESLMKWIGSGGG